MDPIESRPPPHTNVTKRKVGGGPTPLILFQFLVAIGTALFFTLNQPTNIFWDCQQDHHNDVTGLYSHQIKNGLIPPLPQLSTHDTPNQQPPQQLTGNEAAQQQQRKLLTAKEFVHNSFERSGWKDLVEYCSLPSNITKSAMRPDQLSNNLKLACLKSLWRLTTTVGHEYNTNWSWWLQTLVRDTARPINGLFGGFHLLQFKQPELTVCVMEKIGTKQWQKLQCQHHNRLDGERCYGNQAPYNDVSDTAVFLRDPLDRFLSAFLDKCIQQPYEAHCEPRSLFFDRDAGNTMGSLKDWRKDSKKFFKLYVDTLPLTWNLHFFPQSLYCGGLFRSLNSFNFVGNMDTLYKDINRFVAQYPKMEPAMESVFKMSKHSTTSSSLSSVGLTNVTKTKGVETNAATKVLDYYTPETVAKVLEYYAVDYVMLDLPIPEWAETMLKDHQQTTFR